MQEKETYLNICGKKPDTMFELKRSFLHLIRRWLSHIFHKVYPIEVRDDWLRVATMHRRIVERIFSEAKPEGKSVPSKVLDILTISRDCLCAAKNTDLLLDAWRYVNQASESLSFVANEKECAELFERFMEWEPSLQKNLKDIYEKSQEQEFQKNRTNKKTCQEKIRSHSRQWALINQANFFRIRFSMNITIVFLLSLIGMLLASVFIITEQALEKNIDLHYLYIAIYGWFGAALSALLAARELRPSAVTYRTQWFNVFLRLLLGAGGAIVTYVIVTIPGLITTELSESLQNPPGFIAIGIAGGFSERLFRRLLDRVVRQVTAKDEE